MIKTILTVFAAFAVVTFVGLSGQASAQGCSGCAASSGSFAYPAPASSCGRGGCLGHHGQGGDRIQELKNQFAHQQELNAKIAARNDAWPLPFACHDKRSYYNTWATMLAAGNENSSVLDGNFFTDGNQLNRVGIDRVAGIALNSPISERAVFVSRSADESVDQARVSAIRNTIATYYSHRGAVDVRLSERAPVTVAAGTSQAVRENYETNKPAASIFDVESVNESVTE